MNLHHLLLQRAEQRKPLRVVLIGAGKFGSMFLSQARTTRGLHVVAVADIAPARARAALTATGWSAERFDAQHFAGAAAKGTTFVTEDVQAAIAAPETEIV
ncbi:MAG TPA: Gfo/Idh/MocA family oxidoreductase, partial [Casimicrobiaceae bacterium]|nr:Gfo/Idh/MocA family oxidoreductase [Casimicrobiaceae bacterium]